ncbi:MAG: hypothetical protein HAW62_00675 [Endozoicomonadaceae bacterium]|nr:hypothetical protein [Endozoicomonadaceae bacterium]
MTIIHPKRQSIQPISPLKPVNKHQTKDNAVTSQKPQKNILLPHQSSSSSPSKKSLSHRTIQSSHSVNTLKNKPGKSSDLTPKQHAQKMFQAYLIENPLLANPGNRKQYQAVLQEIQRSDPLNKQSLSEAHKVMGWKNIAQSKQLLVELRECWVGHFKTQMLNQIQHRDHVDSRLVLSKKIEAASYKTIPDVFEKMNASFKKAGNTANLKHTIQVKVFDELMNQPDLQKKHDMASQLKKNPQLIMRHIEVAASQVEIVSSMVSSAVDHAMKEQIKQAIDQSQKPDQTTVNNFIQQSTTSSELIARYRVIKLLDPSQLDSLKDQLKTRYIDLLVHDLAGDLLKAGYSKEQVIQQLKAYNAYETPVEFKALNIIINNKITHNAADIFTSIGVSSDYNQNSFWDFKEAVQHALQLQLSREL